MNGLREFSVVPYRSSRFGQPLRYLAASVRAYDGSDPTSGRWLHARRFLTASLLLATSAVVMMPQQVLAQDTTLVKNTGQTVQSHTRTVGHSGTSKFSQAQGFITGTETNGYTLSEVKVGIADPNSSTRVSVYSATTDGKPNASLTTLTNPTSLVEDAINTFSVSGTQTLTANTTYFVVLEHTAATDNYTLSVTQSDAEDSGKASGWSIGNGLFNRNQDTANWTAITTDALRIEIVGSALGSAATGAPVITGTAQVGKTLTADTSGIMDSDGLTSPGYSYQWIRVDGMSEDDITSATSSTYTLVAADVGKTIKVKVDFTDDDSNSESLTSDAYPSFGSVAAAKSTCPSTATWCGALTIGYNTITVPDKTIFIFDTAPAPEPLLPRPSPTTAQTIRSEY